MTAPSLWHVVYWIKGQSPSTAKALTDEPITYVDARAKAKRCKVLPAFFGYVLDVRRA